MTEATTTPAPAAPQRAGPARVLHVLDDRADEACGTTLALLAQTLAEQAQAGVTTRVLLLGGQALGQAVRAAGIADFERVAPPLGRPWLAPTVLHRAFGDDAGQGHTDVVEAWSLMALGAAAIFRPHTPRIMHLLQTPDPTIQRRLNRLMMRAGFDLKTPTGHLRRAVIAGGLPPGRVFHASARLQRPAARPSPTAPAATFDFAYHRPRTVALLGDPAWAVPTADVALAVSMSQEITQRPLRLLVHPDADQRARAQRLLNDLDRPDMLVQDAAADTPWNVFGGIDAVMLGTRAAPLLIPLILDAGLPVLAPDLPQHRELLGDTLDNTRVFWAPDARPRHLAHALTQWVRHEDPTVCPSKPTVGKLLAI